MKTRQRVLLLVTAAGATATQAEGLFDDYFATPTTIRQDVVVDLATWKAPDVGVSYEPAPASPSYSLGSFSLTLNPGPNLQSNPAALAAFERAATQWRNVIADPITVNIDVEITDLGNPSVIGNANPVTLINTYTAVRNQVVLDEGGESSVNGTVAALPTAAQFSALVPTGYGLSGNVVVTKANVEALGVTGLDSIFGLSDGVIQFNSGFGFDYDNTDGVGAGLMDFETVAAHEIGHILGFVSVVDDVDVNGALGGAPFAISPRILDMFRFEDGTGFDPETLAEFTTDPRNLIPGNPAIFDLITEGEVPFSTGTFLGDGRQASHWKDGLGLGLLDPTLATGEVVTLSYNDLLAMDVIGYNIFFTVIPEPSTLLAGAALLGVSFLAVRRRRSFGSSS